MTRDDLQASPPVFFLPRGKVLMVDQDRKDLQSYTGVLQHMGFEVKAFSNCQEALRCLEEGPVDFVFVNQGSTALEWQEIVQCAIVRNRRTPVIVLTRSMDVGCYLEAIYLGAVDYVEKPLTPAEMEYLVTTYFQPPLLKMRHSA